MSGAAGKSDNECQEKKHIIYSSLRSMRQRECESASMSQRFVSEQVSQWMNSIVSVNPEYLFQFQQCQEY